MPTASRPIPKHFPWLAAAFLFIGIAVTLFLISRAHPLPASLLALSRWAVLVTILVYACLRRSMLGWIFAAMIIGGILGYDFPHQTAGLQVITEVFLRLIKAIVAPLIF